MQFIIPLLYFDYLDYVPVKELSALNYWSYPPTKSSSPINAILLIEFLYRGTAYLRDRSGSFYPQFGRRSFEEEDGALICTCEYFHFWYSWTLL